MKRLTLLLLVFGLLATYPSPARADVVLPHVLGSHMVLQRDRPLPIWGTAAPGEKVTVEFAGEKQSATADKNGQWQVEFPAMRANANPQSMTIKGNNTITLEDILIGEVWIGSGQSNMAMQINSSYGKKEAIAAANQPNIRLFHVPKIQSKTPAADVKASWQRSSPKNIGAFSAVLYFFGRKLSKELDVPIGLINSSWGGSPIEPWTIKGGKSGGMYNGMIAPLQPFAIRGVIWYQGETNVLQKNGFAYYGKMKDLIGGWRKAWDYEFPFYFVQIAPWGGRYEKGELPKLWEAQVASLKIPKTGMAVTTDIVDNINDIHPRNKIDVGNRLALWALAKTYGQNELIYSGPLYKSMKIEDSKIRLSFAHTGKGLELSKGKEPTEFEIAGDDGKFVKANAVIDGHTVVVSSPKVQEPAQVRFGWHKLAQPNLVNSAGLPASPFQTKNWRGGTGE